MVKKPFHQALEKIDELPEDFQKLATIFAEAFLLINNKINTCERKLKTIESLLSEQNALLTIIANSANPLFALESEFEN